MFLFGIFFLLNIVSLSFSNNTPDVIYVDFDPLNKSQYAQLLALMEKNKIHFLDLDKEPAVALEEYKKALLGKPKKELEGLRVKLLMTPDLKRVVAFISYLPQETDKELPYWVKAVAVDSEYQRLGFGDLLLSTVEQEAQKEGHLHTCLAVNSFSLEMLGLIGQRPYVVRDCKKLDGYLRQDVDTKKLSDIFTFAFCKESKKSKA
jgi:GNAT superfamily N-acetyltransferase